MQALTFIFAFVAVLALIAAVAWAVRRFAGNRLGANANRSRMPRLAVIDAAAVDGRRRLVLVRRDNVEHLLMIGGPTDIVVEPNIVRASARDQASQRPIASNEPPPRIAPLPDAGWMDSETAKPEAFDQVEPQLPELPARPARPSFGDEMRRAPLPERRSDPMTGFTAEPSLGSRPEPRPEPMQPRIVRGETVRNEALRSEAVRGDPLAPRPSRSTEAPKAAPPVRTERTVAPPPPPPPSPPVMTPQALSDADQNLAEMAQRLEAALRRPTTEAGEPRVGAPSVAPEPPPPGRPAARNNEPPAAPPANPPSPKSGFENLEDEMASLLGRPKTPT
ncbi:MAG TPA: flagellar biosynthetic protein FliO [Bradyrhizobium sp.]|nr:flagellar biosynthetic protein FliO [Bradyrhizobium sp.]